MVNIFSNPNTVDFQLQNNTVYDLAFDAFNNNILKSKSSVNSLNDLKLSICRFKKLYTDSSVIQNWFNDGWVSYTPVIGTAPPDCGDSGGSGTSIPVSATPPSGPINGSLWIRSSDRVLFIYDSSRFKWLSDSFIKISASRNHATVTDQYLMSDEGIYTNIDPFVYTDNLTITKIIAKSSTTITWTLKLKNNNDDTDIASIVVTGGSITNVTANIDLNANTPLAFYLEGTDIGFPNVDLIARYKG